MHLPVLCTSARAPMRRMRRMTNTITTTTTTNNNSNRSNDNSNYCPGARGSGRARFPEDLDGPFGPPEIIE